VPHEGFLSAKNICSRGSACRGTPLDADGLPTSVTFYLFASTLSVTKNDVTNIQQGKSRKELGFALVINKPSSEFLRGHG